MDGYMLTYIVQTITNTSVQTYIRSCTLDFEWNVRYKLTFIKVQPNKLEWLLLMVWIHHHGLVSFKIQRRRNFFCVLLCVIKGVINAVQKTVIHPTDWLDGTCELNCMLHVHVFQQNNNYLLYITVLAYYLLEFCGTFVMFVQFV